MNHGHSITDPGHSHLVYNHLPYGGSRGTDSNDSSTNGTAYLTGYTNSVTTGISVNNYNGNTGDTGSTETRPVNYTYKIWKRIN